MSDVLHGAHLARRRAMALATMVVAMLLAVLPGVALAGAASAEPGGTAAEGAAAAAIPEEGLTFHAIEPERILDSRPGSGNEGPYDTPWGPGTSRLVEVADGTVVPDDAAAVVLNVTVTGTTTASHLSIWPAGETQPVVSSLNWAAGETIANQVTVAVGDAGAISVFNNEGNTNVVIDVNGYYEHNEGLRYTGIAPQRIFDSRPPPVGPFGPPWTAGETRNIEVIDGTIVPEDATAVTFNLTATNTTAASFLSVWPKGLAQPVVSSVNWDAGVTIPNQVTVPVGQDGEISVFNSKGLVDVVVDVSGYFVQDEGKFFFPASPMRIQDSRPATQVGPYDTPWAADTTREVTVAGGSTDVPDDADSVVMNATATDTTAASHLAVSPTGAPPATVSNLNWTAGKTIPNAVTAKVGDEGQDDVYNFKGNVDVVMDVYGWYAKGDQEIEFTSVEPSDARVGGMGYVPEAEATSGLPVEFSIDASSTGICSYSAGAVSFHAVGTCQLNADQAGNEDWNPAPQVNQTIEVGKGDQIINFTSTAPADARVGGMGYVPEAEATSGLPVEFSIDASATGICSYSAGAVSFHAVGTCVINANQAGDIDWNAAPQVQQSFSVGKGDQIVTFTSAAPSNAYFDGPLYTPTAEATSGLPVTITVDPSAAGVCAINLGNVTFQGVGTCVLNANQAGDIDWNAAPQAQQSFSVSKAPQEIDFLTAPPSPALVNGPAYWPVAVSTSGLPVTVAVDVSATSVCSIVGESVMFHQAGTCVLNANQPGNANWQPAIQVQQSFPVVNQVFVAVGNFGRVYLSPDNGATWALAPGQPDTAGLLRGVSSNGDTFVAVDILGRAHRSTDWGAHWSAATVQPSGGVGFSAVSNNGATFVAVDAVGRVYRSTDDGSTWAAATTQPPSAFGLSGVANNGSTFVAVDALGRAYRSTDNGDTWVAASLQPIGGIGLTSVANNGSVFLAVNALGLVFGSVDNGDNWLPTLGQPVGAGPLTSIASNGTTFVAVDTNGQVYRSTTSGLIWTAAGTQPPGAGALQAVANNGSMFVAVDITGKAFTSSNNGNTWVAATTQPPGSGSLFGASH